MPCCRGCGDVIRDDGNYYCESCQPHIAPVSDHQTILSHVTNKQKDARFINQDSGGYGNIPKAKNIAQAVQTVAARGQAPSPELTRNLVRDIAPILPRFRKIGLDPHSGVLKASVNQDSVKCSICDEWFFNESAFRLHRQKFNYSCEEHGKCFADHDAYVHAQNYDHVRCFVPTCTSKYRYETHWQPAKVKAHIWEAHYPKGDKR
jgi:hypothetical protein